MTTDTDSAKCGILAGGGATALTALTDVSVTYAGKAGSIPFVNSAESGITNVPAPTQNLTLLSGADNEAGDGAGSVALGGGAGGLAGGQGGDVNVQGGDSFHGGHGGGVSISGGGSTGANAGGVSIQAGAADGVAGNGGSVSLASGTSESGVKGVVTLNSAGGIYFYMGAGCNLIAALPAADPAEAGAWWNDAGVVKISAGA